jgi:hypothetical protein
MESARAESNRRQVSPTSCQPTPTVHCLAMGDLMPLALSDRQLDIIFDATRPLLPVDRSRFLADVAAELAGCSEPGDGTVARICRQLQPRYFRPPVLAESGKYR